MYGIDTHLFKKGDVVIVLTRWPLGSSFTNTMHVAPTLFCAPRTPPPGPAPSPSPTHPWSQQGLKCSLGAVL